MFNRIEKFITKYKISSLIIVSLIFIAAVLIFTILNITATAEVEILVAPSSATILINGKSYKNGIYNLPKGNLSVKITKDGFTSKEYTFNSAASGKLYDYLTQSDGSYNWYLEHDDDAMTLTKIGDTEASVLSNSYNAKHPIIEHLPIIVAFYDDNDNYTEYRIDGGSFLECNTDFCLKITDTTGGNLEPAKNNLVSLGFSPDDYQIIYEYSPITPLSQ